MSTPAKRHFERVTAEQQNLKDAKHGHGQPTGDQYELMLMQLQQHKQRLKDIQSQEQKAKVKAEILPEYEAYVKGVLESDSGLQDEVLLTIMVWRIDAGDLWGALDIAKYALHHKLVTPERFNRDTATLIAEEVAEWALKQDQPVDSSLLQHTDHITVDQDMPDEVRAKLHKALGLSLEEKEPTEALRHFKRALELNDNSGVKKMIERVARAIKNAADT
ncbi:MAG: terminase [Gammaproteobacteria bacterium]|nr:terminase [Gammaproteobacteria bacterium]